MDVRHVKNVANQLRISYVPAAASHHLNVPVSHESSFFELSAALILYMILASPLVVSDYPLDFSLFHPLDF